LILQSVLGGADTPFADENQKFRGQYQMEVSMVFKHVHRLIRCIIDCQICLGDSVAVRNALMLERSLGARAWDDSPLQMKQVAGIGAVTVRKLVNSGIKSIDELENTEASRIQMILSKNPPFGTKLLNQLNLFPKLRVSVHVQLSSVSLLTIYDPEHVTSPTDHQRSRRREDYDQSRDRILERKAARQFPAKAHICVLFVRDFRWATDPFRSSEVCSIPPMASII
jgi:hypothetical protein